MIPNRPRYICNIKIIIFNRRLRQIVKLFYGLMNFWVSQFFGYHLSGIMGISYVNNLLLSSTLSERTQSDENHDKLFDYFTRIRTDCPGKIFSHFFVSDSLISIMLICQHQHDLSCKYLESFWLHFLLTYLAMFSTKWKHLDQTHNNDYNDSATTQAAETTPESLMICTKSFLRRYVFFLQNQLMFNQ